MGISRAEALEGLRSDDLIRIGMEADSVRRRLHPEGVVSYAAVGRLACTGGDILSVYGAAEEILERGGSGLSLRHPAVLGAEGVERLIAELRRRHPSAWIAGLSAADVRQMVGAGRGRVSELISRLRDAGLSSLSAEGPDLAAGVTEWLEVQEAAHGAGLRTVASMRFGAGDTVDDRVGFLETVRNLQERTNGFAALIIESAGGGLDGPTAVECLKTLAVSRLMVETIETVQVGAMASGLKVLEMGLRFGADDAGEVLVGGSEARVSSDEEDLRRVIRDAGFMPVERDAGYRMMFVA